MRIKLFGKLACVYLGVGIAWMAFRWMSTPLGQVMFFLGSCITGASLAAMTRQGKKGTQTGFNEKVCDNTFSVDLYQSIFTKPFIVRIAIVGTGIILIGENIANLFSQRHLHQIAANETLALVPTILLVFGMSVAGIRLLKVWALPVFVVGTIIEFAIAIATIYSRHVATDRSLATISVGLLLVQLGVLMSEGTTSHRVNDSEPPGSAS